MFKKHQEAFFALVKAGLWENANKNQNQNEYRFEGLDWDEVQRLAEEQSVVGLVAAGFNQLTAYRLPLTEKLTLLGKCQLIEQRNLAMNDFIAKMFARLKDEGIAPLLMKGQGVAQCYERPLWRASGDVDLLLTEKDYQAAKYLLLPEATSVEQEYTSFKHIAMHFGDVEVELHGCLHTRLSKRLDASIDTLQDEMFREKKFGVWNNGGVPVPVPAPEYGVLFVLTHILKHYYVEGIGLRQVCDWCRLLWTYRDVIDRKTLECRLKKIRLTTEWKAFAAVAVDYLGMPVDAMPLYSPDLRWSRKANHIISFIFKTGNFGHNRQRVKPKTYLGGKLRSTHRKFSDFAHHAFDFPVDSARFFWGIFTDGFAAATRGGNRRSSEKLKMKS